MELTTTSQEHSQACQNAQHAAKKAFGRARQLGSLGGFVEEDCDRRLEELYWHYTRYELHHPNFQAGLGTVLLGEAVEGMEPVTFVELVTALESLPVRNLRDVVFLEETFWDLFEQRRASGAPASPRQGKLLQWLLEKRQQLAPNADPGAARSPLYDPELLMGFEILFDSLPNAFFCPPHTWSTLDGLAREVKIIDEHKVFIAGYQKQGAITGFLEALKEHGYVTGDLAALCAIFAERYGVTLNSKRPSLTRLEYLTKTEKILTRRRHQQ